MDSAVSAHLIYGLANAAIRPWPFPHVYFENVFPDDFHAKLQETMPEFEAYDPIEKVRNVATKAGRPAERFVVSFNDGETGLDPHWETARSVLMSRDFVMALIGKFHSMLADRLNGETELALSDVSAFGTN